MKWVNIIINTSYNVILKMQTNQFAQKCVWKHPRGHIKLRKLSIVKLETYYVFLCVLLYILQQVCRTAVTTVICEQI